VSKIKYKSGYKYQTWADYAVQTEIKGYNVDIPFVTLRPSGVLFISQNYSWDGPSGPALDTKNFMRGSLIHDALYQLIREGYLGQSTRLAADKELRKICREDGMSAIRAWWVYQGVRLFGGKAASKDGGRKIEEAP